MSKKNTFEVSLILHGCVHHLEKSPSTNGFLFQEISQRSRFTVLTAYFPFYTPLVHFSNSSDMFLLELRIKPRELELMTCEMRCDSEACRFNSFRNLDDRCDQLTTVINKTHLIYKECSKINGWIS